MTPDFKELARRCISDSEVDVLKARVRNLETLLRNENENYRREHFQRVAAEKSRETWKSLYLELKALFERQSDRVYRLLCLQDAER